MQPINCKRSFEASNINISNHSSQENLPKRRRVDSSLLPIRSDSPFKNLPNEVIAFFFQRSPIRDLLNFERVCWNHSGLTGVAWHDFRGRKFFLLDWKVCEGNHRSNYLLSKAVVDFVEGLPLPLGAFGCVFKKQALQKFQWIRQQFPLFEALIQLFQLQKDETNLPKELASRLEQEEILQLITSLYLFAKRLWLKRGNAACKQQEAEIQQFHLKLKPRIKQFIGMNGTYFSSLTTHILNLFFERLPDSYKIGLAVRQIAIELAHEALKNGDYSGYEAIHKSQLSIYSLEEQASPHLLGEEDFKTGVLIDEFIRLVGSKSSSCIASWPHIQHHLDKLDLSIDKLEKVFKFHFYQDNWIEADRYFRRMWEKQSEKYLFSTDLLFKAGHVKMVLEKWEEAEQLYEQGLFSDRCGILVEEQLDMVKIKCKLGKWEETVNRLQGIVNNPYTPHPPEIVYTTLIDLYCNKLNSREQALNVYYLANQHYADSGLPTPRAIIQQGIDLQNYINPNSTYDAL